MPSSQVLSSLPWTLLRLLGKQKSIYLQPINHLKLFKVLRISMYFSFFTCRGPYECEEGYDWFEEDTLEEHTEHHNKNGR